MHEFIVVSDLFMIPRSSRTSCFRAFPCLSGENITMPCSMAISLGFKQQVIEPLFTKGGFEYDWFSEGGRPPGLKEQFTCGRTARRVGGIFCKELKKTETELPDYEGF